MSLKKAEKPQDVLYIKVASINTESQKTPAECRFQINRIACNLFGQSTGYRVCRHD